MVLLMAPAAYHRLVYAGEDNEEMHHTGSLLVTLATVPLAIRLAGDLPRLRALRSSLREKMRSSPLMDAALFARGIETAYRSAWQRWCGDRAANPAEFG